jgi:tetratricopeptide (TPR) repeat protein
MDKNEQSFLVVSTNAAACLAISWILKGFSSSVEQAKAGATDEIIGALVGQLKKNLKRKDSAERDRVIVLNCHDNHEYRNVLDPLSKEILKNKMKWAQEGINFSSNEIDNFMEAFIINHYVKGADFIYQIENNEKIHVGFGDLDTNDLLSCSNLFGEMGISFSTYYEKELEPSAKDVQQYNNYLQVGKEAAQKKLAGGGVTGEDVASIVNQFASQSTLVKKSDQIKERLLNDLKIFLKDKEKRKAVSQSRASIVESADIFKKYLELKDEAIHLREKEDYQGMEKVLQKAIDLLETAGKGDAQKKSLFDTYLDLGKGQLQQKKYISAQKNVSSAKKIKKEAPSPHRLMGECQMGQGTDALKKGDYKEAVQFFDRASEQMQECHNIAKHLDKDECAENEKKMAISVSIFEEEAKLIAATDPKAEKALKESMSFNSLVKVASAFKEKYKEDLHGKLKPEISQEEIKRKIGEAGKLALEAVRLVLEKKGGATATEIYKKAASNDEMTAFKTVSKEARNHKGKGEFQKAHDLYAWLAEVDKSEADLQLLNIAECSLLLGNRDKAIQHIRESLQKNKNVIHEARELDPEFEKSEVMKLYLEELKK